MNQVLVKGVECLLFQVFPRIFSCMTNYSWIFTAWLLYILRIKLVYASALWIDIMEALGYGFDWQDLGSIEGIFPDTLYLLFLDLCALFIKSKIQSGKYITVGMWIIHFRSQASQHIISPYSPWILPGGIYSVVPIVTPVTENQETKKS